MTTILQAARAVVPHLTSALRKGECGRVAVIGGSSEYTGAPYFAAMSALRTGADLAHVFCTPAASPVIKSYHPDLIVHPLLPSESTVVPNAVKSIVDWLPRIHVLIIGPGRILIIGAIGHLTPEGLGRDAVTLECVVGIVEAAKEMNLPMVFDADSLFLLSKSPNLLANYTNVILTPNVVEVRSPVLLIIFSLYQLLQFGRLEEAARTHTNLLCGPTILQKGASDIIADTKHSVPCDEEGSMRRCGGQVNSACISCLHQAHALS